MPYQDEHRRAGHLEVVDLKSVAKPNNVTQTSTGISDHVENMGFFLHVHIPRDQVVLSEDVRVVAEVHRELYDPLSGFEPLESDLHLPRSEEGVKPNRVHVLQLLHRHDHYLIHSPPPYTKRLDDEGTLVSS